MHRRMFCQALSLALASGLAMSAYAQTNFPEVEPNETKAQALANLAFVLANGDTLSGNTTGSSTTTPGAASADTFLVKTAPAALGIYRHQMVLTTTGTAGHVGTIRGLNQTAPGPGPGVIGTTDTAVQTSSATATTPARMNQWYGFGKEEQVYYRVTGVAGTTADYLATLTTTPVTATNVGSFAAGMVTIDTIGRTGATQIDTDLWLYDSNFSAIAGAGNDDESVLGGGTGVTGGSLLRRTLTAGTYYMAITNFNFANDQPSPADDDFRTAAVLDFPDAAANSSTTANVNVGFAVTDASGPQVFAATRSGFEIVWVTFTVTGSVPSGGCCFNDGSCTVQTQLDCVNAGGAWAGAGTDCTTANCPVGGACCFANGSCTFLTSAACTAQSGTWSGPGITCVAANCPQPPNGACCAPNSTCTEVSVFACTAAGGTWLGANTLCASVTCPTILPLAGAPNNGLTAAGGGVFVDLTAINALTVRRFDYYASSAAGTPTTVEVWTYPGSYVGHDGSNVSWVLSQTINSTSAGTTALAPLILTTPLPVAAGQTVGVYLIAQVGGIRYLGTGAAIQTTYADSNLSVFTERVRSAPWAGTLFTPRAMSGQVYYTLDAGVGCYADCDEVGGLTANDFICFVTAFNNGDSYANCDGVGGLTANDFICFLTAYNNGCS
jgi:hypothetical protein